MYLLDTHVVSALRKAGTPLADSALVAWAGSVESRSLYIASITVLELEIGVQRMERKDPRQGQILREWLTQKVLTAFAGRVLPFDLIAAQYCARLHVPNPRSDRDSFIAAIGRTCDMIVVTRNVRDFESMGVELFNPWQEP